MSLRTLASATASIDLSSSETSGIDTQAHGVQKVWYGDGTIVIQAGASSFCVYRGILAENSSVFSDMVAVGSESLSQDTIDGRPVVRVSDDPAEMSYFLKALHDRSFFSRSRKCDVRVALGILRLAHKYDATHLRKVALSRMRERSPDTLQGWDARSKDLPYDGLRDTGATVIAIANTLREVDARLLLPTALYNVSCFATINQLVEGQTYEGVHYELGQADKSLCLTARQTLLLVRHNGMLQFLRDVRQDCKAPFTCGPHRWLALVRPIDEIGVMTKPPLRAVRALHAKEAEVCESCRDADSASYEGLRRKIWEDLPGLFGLPGWAQLRLFEP